jgi:hypothetical protein
LKALSQLMCNEVITWLTPAWSNQDARDNCRRIAELVIAWIAAAPIGSSSILSARICVD